MPIACPSFNKGLLHIVNDYAMKKKIGRQII